MRASPVKRTIVIAALAASAMALGACETVGEAMGIGKMPPDEYAVAPRRPLAMPPDYNLRAPQPGAASPADISASGTAARALGNAGGEGIANPAPAPAPVPDEATVPTAPPPATEPPIDVPQASEDQEDQGGRVLTTEP